MERKLDQQQMAQAADPAIVSVHVPLDLLWDFDGLMEVKRNILRTLGCQACTSGYDIRWRGVRDAGASPGGEIRPANETAE